MTRIHTSLAGLLIALAPAIAIALALSPLPLAAQDDAPPARSPAEDKVLQRLLALPHDRQQQVFDALGVTSPEGYFNCVCRAAGYGSSSASQYYHPDTIGDYDPRYSCNHPGPPCIVSGYGCTRHPMPSDPAVWDRCRPGGGDGDGPGFLDQVLAAVPRPEDSPAPTGPAAPTASPPARDDCSFGKLVSFAGLERATGAGAFTPVTAAALGQGIQAGDTLRTGPDGYAILSGDGLEIGPGTVVQFGREVGEAASEAIDAVQDAWADRERIEAETVESVLGFDLRGFEKTTQALWDKGYAQPDQPWLPTYVHTGADHAVLRRGQELLERHGECVGATHLKLLLDAHQDDWTDTAVLRLAGSFLATKLIPNKPGFADKLLQWKPGVKLPGLGELSKGLDLLSVADDSYKFFAGSAKGQVGRWKLAAFERGRDLMWDGDEINDQILHNKARIAAHRQTIAEIQAQIRQEARDYAAETKRLLATEDADLARELARLDGFTDPSDPAQWAAILGPESGFDRGTLGPGKTPTAGDFYAEVAALKDRARAGTNTAKLAIQAAQATREGASYAQHLYRIHGLLVEIARNGAEAEVLDQTLRPIAAGKCGELLKRERERAARERDRHCRMRMEFDGRVRAGSRGQAKPVLAPGLMGFTFGGGTRVIPEGTWYEVARDGDTGQLRVFEGRVSLLHPSGATQTIAAGQQISLPDGTLSPLPEGAEEAGVMLHGLPAGHWPLDDGSITGKGPFALALAGDNTPLNGWLWQAPGTASTLTAGPTPDAVDLTLSAPHGFGDGRWDAPRLLRKMTGDFDLVTRLDGIEATGKVGVDLLLYAPGVGLGVTSGQIDDPRTAGADFLRLDMVRSDPDGTLQVPGFDGTPAALPTSDRSDGTWLRLSRRGTLVTTHVSPDRRQWTLVGRHAPTLPDTLWAGLVVHGAGPARVTLSSTGTNALLQHLSPLPLADFTLPQGLAEATDAGVLPIHLSGADQITIAGTQPFMGDLDITLQLSQLAPVDRAALGLALSGPQGVALETLLRADETGMMLLRPGQGALPVGTEAFLRLSRQGGELSAWAWTGEDWSLIAQDEIQTETPLFLDITSLAPAGNPALARIAVPRIAIGALARATPAPPD